MTKRNKVSKLTMPDFFYSDIKGKVTNWLFGVSIKLFKTKNVDCHQRLRKYN